MRKEPQLRVPSLGGFSLDLMEPLISWEVLNAAGYAYPPHYVDYEFPEDGVTRCHVNFILIAHPVHPEWPVLIFDVLGHRLEDTWELAVCLDFQCSVSLHRTPC